MQLGIKNAQLNKVHTFLTKFREEVVEALRELTLSLSLGTYCRRVTKMMKLAAVETSSTYNMILDEANLESLQSSGFHLPYDTQVSYNRWRGKANGNKRMT